ncbi:hypothetical protein ACLKA7_004686 [Drosophila subpalustris]
MNPSFEEIWSSSSSPQNGDSNVRNMFASMQPYRVPFEKPTGSDAQMVLAYKAMHSWNVVEAPGDLEMIQSKTICRKCMLHTKVCRQYGHNLKNYEAQLHLAKKMRSGQTKVKKRTDNLE